MWCDDDDDDDDDDDAYWLHTRVKSTKIVLKKMESNKACTWLICKKSYEFVWFLWSYKVHTSDFVICFNTTKVRVDNRLIHPFQTNTDRYI